MRVSFGLCRIRKCFTESSNCRANEAISDAAWSSSSWMFAGAVRVSSFKIEMLGFEDCAPRAAQPSRGLLDVVGRPDTTMYASPIVSTYSFENQTHFSFEENMFAMDKSYPKYYLLMIIFLYLIHIISFQCCIKVRVQVVQKSDNLHGTRFCWH